MADINLSIGADNKELQRKIAEANKLLAKQAREQERIDARLSRKRARNRLKDIREARRSEEQAAIASERMEDRLSRKRARNRLKAIRERVRAEKAAQREIERAEQISAQKRSRMFKRGAAGAVGLGFAAGAFGTVMGRGILDFDERLARSAVQAGKTREEQAALRQKMTEVSIATGAQRADLLDAFEAIIDKSGLAYDVAFNNLDKIAMALRGTGAEARDLGLLFASISKIGKGMGLDDNGVFGLMEMLIAQGDEGAINLAEMASEAQKVMGIFSASGMKGVKEFAQYMGLVQIAGDFGTKSEAATMAAGMMSQFGKRSKFIEKDNPNVTITDANGVLLPLDKVIGSILKESGGNLDILRKWFPEEMAMKPLFAMANQYRAGGGLDLLNRYTNIGMGASGNVEKKYERVNETSGQAFQKLQALFISMTDSALVPTLESLANSIKELVSDPARMAELQKTFKGLGELLGKLADMSSSPLINFMTGNTSAQIEAKRKKDINEKINALTPEQKKAFDREIGFDISRPFKSKEKQLSEIESALNNIELNLQVVNNSNGTTDVKMTGLNNWDTGSKKFNKQINGAKEFRFYNVK